MPATSLASGDELRLAAQAPVRLPAAASLWLEAARAALARSGEAAKASLRHGWLYRQTLGGRVADRILIQVDDPEPQKLEQAEALFRGRYRFAGQMLEAKDTSPFDGPWPSPAFATALLGFDWLGPLDEAGGEAARCFALQLAQQFVRRFARYSRVAWQPETIGRRFVNLGAHSRFFIVNSDLLWRSKFFVSLRGQARVLARTAAHAPEGLPRLEAAVGLAFAGLGLDEPRHLESGLARVEAELHRQLLPDGGHLSRAPETLAHTFRLLAMLRHGLEQAAYPVPGPLAEALDRMIPMMRFFRMGDGALCVFNGGAEGDPKMLAALIGRSDIAGRPYAHAPHSGYHRLAAGRTVVITDVGAPPPGPFACEAHAGCLAFEMSVGNQRVIVNCGAAHGQDESWNTALRATAAHSTLTLGDTSFAFVLPPGWLRDMLGPRLVGSFTDVETVREETAEGTIVTSKHDGYAAAFGVVHERRLSLSPKGLVLTGLDRLTPGSRPRGRRKRPAVQFAIRFHIHPDVRVSLAQGGGSVLLKLPSGDGWRFRCGGGTLSVEESVYLGSGQVRRTEQLVLTGHVKDEAIESVWLFEQVGAA